MLADMAAEIEAARWLIYRRPGCCAKNKGRSHTKEASIAELVATEMAERSRPERDPDPRRLWLQRRVPGGTHLPRRPG